MQGHSAFVLPGLQPSTHLMSCCPHQPWGPPAHAAACVGGLSFCVCHWSSPPRGDWGVTHLPPHTEPLHPSTCLQGACRPGPYHRGFMHTLGIGANSDLEFTDMKFGYRGLCSIPPLSLMEPQGAEAERPRPPPRSEGSASRTALMHSPVPHLGLANEPTSAASP